jgi:hypothetical protein
MEVMAMAEEEMATVAGGYSSGDGDEQRPQWQLSDASDLIWRMM